MVRREEDVYTNSVKRLKEYLRNEKRIPSEKEWNRYAVSENLLSAQTISYLSGMGFNRVCRNLLKEITQEKKDCKWKFTVFLYEKS